MSLTAPSYEPISPCESIESDTRKVVLCDPCVFTTITTEQSITINQGPVSGGNALYTHASFVNTNRATVAPLTSHNTTWSSYPPKNTSAETKKLFPIFYRSTLTKDKTLGKSQNTMLSTSIPTINAPPYMIPSTIPFTLPSDMMPHSTVANTIPKVEPYTTHHDYPIAGTSTSWPQPSPQPSAIPRSENPMYNTPNYPIAGPSTSQPQQPSISSSYIP